MLFFLFSVLLLPWRVFATQILNIFNCFMWALFLNQILYCFRILMYVEFYLVTKKYNFPFISFHEVIIWYIISHLVLHSLFPFLLKLLPKPIMTISSSLDTKSQTGSTIQHPSLNPSTQTFIFSVKIHDLF